MIRAALLGLALCLAPLPAPAHRIIASVFPSGEVIEGEIGMSSGEMAAGQLVEVFGPDGAKLGEAETDEDGFFTYRPTLPVALTFRADLGAGHVAEAVMPAAEVAAILGRTLPVIADPGPPAGASLAAQGVAVQGAPAPAGLSDADRAAIATIVRDEIRPLRREIAAYREKNDLQTILGGLGYIAGLFGLGFYLAARRRLRG